MQLQTASLQGLPGSAGFNIPTRSDARFGKGFDNLEVCLEFSRFSIGCHLLSGWPVEAFNLSARRNPSIQHDETLPRYATELLTQLGLSLVRQAFLHLGDLFHLLLRLFGGGLATELILELLLGHLLPSWYLTAGFIRRIALVKGGSQLITVFRRFCGKPSLCAWVLPTCAPMD